MYEKGEGCYLYDMENRKYLDLTAGIAVNALGHCDEGMATVIAEQVRYNRTGYLVACESLTLESSRHGNLSTHPTSTTTLIPACFRSSLSN
jgi:acetylornithine/succinyldiaminopimelate/putrescine aminotransferase